MQQWFQDHIGYFILVALAGAWRARGLIFKPVSWYFDAKKQIHDTENKLSTGYERANKLLIVERDGATSERAKTLQLCDSLKAEMARLIIINDERQDINRQDRIAKAVYLRNLRSWGADVDNIEREIRVAIKEVYQNGNST